MEIARRRWSAGLVVSLAFVCTAAVSVPAAAQGYPAKALHFIVPAASGGVSDNSVRALTQSLTQLMGQPILIENRAGANGNIGAEACARAVPDGYTACFLQGVLVALNPLAYANIPFDTERDFAPIATTASGGTPEELAEIVRAARRDRRRAG